MEESNAILSDIEKANEQNSRSRDVDLDLVDIEESEALDALASAEQAEGLSSLSFASQSHEDILVQDQEPAFESQQTVFVKPPQNVHSSQSSFPFEYNEGSFEVDCKIRNKVGRNDNEFNVF